MWRRHSFYLYISSISTFQDYKEQLQSPNFLLVVNIKHLQQSINIRTQYTHWVSILEAFLLPGHLSSSHRVRRYTVLRERKVKLFKVFLDQYYVCHPSVRYVQHCTIFPTLHCVEFIAGILDDRLINGRGEFHTSFMNLDRLSTIHNCKTKKCHNFLFYRKRPVYCGNLCTPVKAISINTFQDKGSKTL